MYASWYSLMRVKNNIYASEFNICVAALMWITVSGII